MGGPSLSTGVKITREVQVMETKEVLVMEIQEYLVEDLVRVNHTKSLKKKKKSKRKV